MTQPTAGNSWRKWIKGRRLSILSFVVSHSQIFPNSLVIGINTRDYCNQKCLVCFSCFSPTIPGWKIVTLFKEGLNQISRIWDLPMSRALLVAQAVRGEGTLGMGYRFITLSPTFAPRRRGIKSEIAAHEKLALSAGLRAFTQVFVFHPRTLILFLWRTRLDDSKLIYMNYSTCT
jgi:hypothetical protein